MFRYEEYTIFFSKNQDFLSKTALHFVSDFYTISKNELKNNIKKQRGGQ